MTSNGIFAKALKAGIIAGVTEILLFSDCINTAVAWKIIRWWNSVVWLEN